VDDGAEDTTVGKGAVEVAMLSYCSRARPNQAIRQTVSDYSCERKIDEMERETILYNDRYTHNRTDGGCPLLYQKGGSLKFMASLHVNYSMERLTRLSCHMLARVMGCIEAYCIESFTMIDVKVERNPVKPIGHGRFGL